MLICHADRAYYSLMGIFYIECNIAYGTPDCQELYILTISLFHDNISLVIQHQLYYGGIKEMPPRVKITRDSIIESAVGIIRKKGMEALGARSIAADLGCSTQPVFSNFRTMEELKDAAIQAADALYQGYIRQEISRREFPPYKASGMAYIRFAREERELFRLLFMRDRTGEKIDESTEEIDELLNILRQNVGLSRKDAYLFHLEMWIYVHGIATMIATSYLEWDPQMVSRMLTDAYEGMKIRYADRERSEI